MDVTPERNKFMDVKSTRKDLKIVWINYIKRSFKYEERKYDLIMMKLKHKNQECEPTFLCK